MQSNDIFFDIGQEKSDDHVTKKDNSTYQLNQELSKSWDDLFKKARESELTSGSVGSPYEQSVWIYRAVNLISTNFPQAILQIKQNDKILPPEHKLVKLFNSPNPTTSRFEFFESLAAYLNLTGEVFIYANNSLYGNAMRTFQPTELWVLNPKLVQHSLDEQNRLAGWVYESMYVPIEQMVHVKLFNPSNPIRGLSPITAARLEMEADYAGARYNNKMLANSAVPEGVIEQDKDKQIDIKELRKLKQLWEANHMSPENAGKTAFLGPGMTYKPISLSQKDMQYLELRKFSRESIMSIFGVSSFVAGYYSDGTVTRATAKEATRLFWESTLIPQLTRIEEKLNSTFFKNIPNTVCKFDYSHIDDLKEDYSLSVDMATKLMAMGYSRNEVNNALKLNMPDDDDDGNIRYMPSNLMAVDIDETPPESSEEKSIKKSIKKDYQEDYLDIQGKLEKKLKIKIKKILFKQRSAVLAALNPRKNKDLTFEDAAEIMAAINAIFSNSEWLLSIEPIYRESLESAAQFAQDTLHIRRPFQISETILNNRLNLIRGMNDTTFKTVRQRVYDGIQAGSPINDIASTIKDYFNQADARSIIVARTETNALMSEQSRETYKDNGVKQKQWISTIDEHTRQDSRADHVSMNGEIVGIDEPFSNGLMQPGDNSGPAYEVVNCRCVLVPIVETE